MNYIEVLQNTQDDLIRESIKSFTETVDGQGLSEIEAWQLVAAIATEKLDEDKRNRNRNV